MSFLHLFQISYYFDSNAWSTFAGFWIVLGIAAVALIASVILRIKSKKMAYAKREVIERITGPVFVVSWVFLLWMFFRYEGVPYLSWRLWPLLLVIYLVVEAVLLVKFIRIDLPKKREGKNLYSDTKQKYLKRFSRK